jgi:hypothetical protein
VRKKFIREANFGKSGVNSKIAQILTHSGTNAAYLDAVFDGYDKLVIAR